MSISMPRRLSLALILALCPLSAFVPRSAADVRVESGAAASKIENSALTIDADQKAGTYTIRSKENPRAWITAAVAAQVNQRWLRSSDYPQHEVAESSLADDLGAGSQLTITYSGLPGQPDLVCSLRLRAQSAFAEIEVQVRNNTATQLTVQSIRVLDAQAPVLTLDGPASADRVLSDSFSEDRPNMEIHDLMQPTEGMHRAVGSQLIYNRQSRQSLFVGALTSERWLTVLRLHVDKKQNTITGYEVDSTGTTELAKENSLKQSPPEDQIELSLPVEPGQSLGSEPIVASFSSDYHARLESYGEAIRHLHPARVSAPTPIGWWSWTAFYFGLTEGPALTNAEFLSAHLRDYGYTFFHIDEGYQFARGDYTSPVANKYPHGIKNLEEKVHALGLTPDELSAVFADWNKGELDSYLIEISSIIFAKKDEDGTPIIDKILDTAGQKGTGKWTVMSALDLGMPVTLIGESVFARCLSAIKEERVEASKFLQGPTGQAATADRADFIENVRRALYCSKIISYAQGYMVLREAAKEFGWRVNMGGIALMWRGGCIIRSRFLGKIKEAYDKQPDLHNLLFDSFFAGVLNNYQASWRKAIVKAIALGVPAPAFSTALAFYDGYRTARLPANLLQAQRDFFGAHTYERVDQPRGQFFHTNWTGRGGRVSSTTYNA